MPVVTKATGALRPISKTSTIKRLSLHLQNPMHTGGQLRLRASMSAVTSQVRARQLGCHLQLEVPLHTQEMLIMTVLVFPLPRRMAKRRLLLSETELQRSRVNDNPRPTEYMTQRTHSGRYQCLWVGDCNRTFSRPFDRNHHMQTHRPKEAEPRFECPEAKTLPWCDRTGANAFTREDHRDQHRRKVHKVRIPPKPRAGGKRHGNGLHGRALDENSLASERTR